MSTVLEIYSHAAGTTNNGSLVIPRFETEIGFTNDGYKIQASQAKATRQRTKKRTSVTESMTLERGIEHSSCISTGAMCNVDGKTDDDNREPVQRNLNLVDAFRQPATTITPGKSSESAEKMSSNSYAAVVSRRNGGELLKFDNGYKEFETDFAPLVSTTTSAMSILSIVDQKTVTTQDVGIQVNLVSSSPKSAIQSKNQGTMTNRKGRFKNKYVTVKMCCNGEDKPTLQSSPPVQFLGEQFNFENAVAKSVSQLGVRFTDLEDDIIPIHLK